MSPDDASMISALAFVACIALACGGMVVADRSDRAPGTIAGIAMTVAGALGSIAALIAGG